MFGFICLLIAIGFGVAFFSQRKKFQKEAEDFTPPTFYNPLPYNLGMQNIEDNYLNIQKVDIEPETQSSLNSNFSQDTLKQDQDNDLLKPDDILVNGNTGEIKMASDQFNETKFTGDSEKTTIEPVQLVKVDKVSANNSMLEPEKTIKESKNSKVFSEEKQLDEFKDDNGTNWKEDNKSAINDLFD